MRTICVLGLALLIGVALVGAEEKVRTITFGKDDVGKVPTGWTAAQTGKGKSEWKVIADASAPSKTGFVLAQTTDNREALFNLCVADDSNFKDIEVSVAFKAMKGQKDQGGGIMWRYQDANNYYVARVNPLEDNFRVYKVVAGKRSKEFQSADVKAPEGEWHTLKVKVEGDHIQCFFNGKKYLDVKDDSITKPGKVGLWTKADAQTHFDDLKVSGK
jgi:hypothetical protein